MCYGHGTDGLIGITLNEKAVHRWAMSLHNCSRLVKHMADLKDSTSVGITSYKEELASRIKYDENDRQVIREKLKLCIDSLNTAGQASALVNIVYGCICPDEVMYMMLLTCAMHRWKSMMLAGHRVSTNSSKKEFAQ